MLNRIIPSFDKENKNQLSSEPKLVNNNQLHFKQVRLLAGVLVAVVIVLGSTIIYVNGKVVKKDPKADLKPELKLETADKALDPDQMWRNHYEEELKKRTDQLHDRLTEAEKSMIETKSKIVADTQKEIESLFAQVKAARQELREASYNLQTVTEKQNERLNARPEYNPSPLEFEDFSGDTEYDQPKPVESYIPEGTYFTGYLLGGIVVSTAMSTPDSNATPLTIRLQGRGNLSASNKLDISKCRITGSAYGDLSSERAVIRLEKLICEQGGMYITTNIAGDVHGPDGFNGVRGEVVSTNAKHIQNAMIGGLVSGLSNSAKGEQGAALTGMGAITTRSRGFKDIAGQGVLQGASNAGEKIADYYLRQAESMSPVLVISGGVRVNAHITKGFYLGELSTHQKVKDARVVKNEVAKNEAQQSSNVKSEKQPANQTQLQGSDDDWKN